MFFQLGKLQCRAAQIKKDNTKYFESNKQYQLSYNDITKFNKKAIFQNIKYKIYED